MKNAIGGGFGCFAWTGLRVLRSAGVGPSATPRSRPQPDGNHEERRSNSGHRAPPEIKQRSISRNFKPARASGTLEHRQFYAISAANPAYPRSFVGVSHRSDTWPIPPPRALPPPLPAKNIALTFPDGARREYPQGHHRSRHRERHLALARQAHGRDGARRHARRPDRPDRAGRQDRVRVARGPARAGTDPPRCRACAGRSGAGAVAGHPGDHRAGDRERLLLRLLPQPAVHPGGLPGDREEDARDHRARQTVHQGDLGPREDQAGLPRQGRELQGRAGRRHSRATSRSGSITRATGSIFAAART